MKTRSHAAEALELDALAGSSDHASIHFPPFRLDAGNERLWRGKRLVALRPKTFSVLRYLLERPGQLIRKEELLDTIWGDVAVGEAVLKTSLGEIRRALGDSARTPRFIETAHRRGYRFIGRVLCAHEPDEEPPASSERSFTGGATMQNDPISGLLASEPFVGREPELVRLEACARSVLTGERRVVFVAGEPGIGKTSLVRAFAARLVDEGSFALAWGQCVDQRGAGDAYLPLIEALRRLSRGPERRALATILRREAPSWLAHVPGLVDHADASAARLAFGAMPERLLCELAEALESFTRERPLILWIEDLHWADHSTLAALSYLARRTDSARLLVLASYRPLAARARGAPSHLSAELSLRAGCEELELGFLSANDIELYFARRFPGHRLPAPLLAAVRAQTAGNPLFLGRVVESWLDRGLLSEDTGVWELCVPLERVLENAPASIVAMIEREMEALDEFESAVLQAASVAGMEFSAASIAAALDEDLGRVETLCLRWARRRQFFCAARDVAWPDGTVAAGGEFIHALYRQAAYEGMGSVRRARFHARIGAREESGYGERAEEIATGLALHFERGQEPEKAIAYLSAAGWQALRRSACREAIEHFRRALSLVQRQPPSAERQLLELDLLVALGAPLAMTLGHAAPEVEQVYSRARDLCAEQAPTTHLFQAMFGVGSFYLVRGEYTTARAASLRLLALLDQRADAGSELQAHLLHGVALIFLGDLAGAERALARTIALYRPEQHRTHVFLFIQDPCVCALALSIFAPLMRGLPERARERAARAFALAGELDHPAALALGHLALAQVEYWCESFERSRSHAEAGLALAAEHGFALYEQTLRMQLGATWIALGESDRGLDCLRAGLAALSAAGADFAGTVWRSILAEGLVSSGRLEEAALVLRDAFAQVRREREIFWEPELYRVLGTLLRAGVEPSPELLELAFESGADRLDAERCFSTALALSRERGV
ncbi:MAG TPA: AAA family ATPase, partial [Polyangiaceae bacterium]